jgi:V8-like Glu-specific endopeptidase
MLPDQYQIDQTLARFATNAANRARNEQLIKEGKLLQVDTPDRVRKFLARRGIVRSPAGYELSGNLQPDAQELTGTGTVEVLERIIGTSDLMGIAFLERGLQIAKSIGRVWVDVSAGQAAAYGTGFLVSPRLLLTNHHVLGDKAVAAKSLVQFDYALQSDGRPYPTATFAMDPSFFHLADQHLDYALVGVTPMSQEGRSLDDFGWNSLMQEEGKAIAAQYGNIIQHPNGEMKQLTLRENRIVDVLPEFLHYTADTQGGSSGSPVYNDRWEVVALHHSGVWKTNEAGEPISVDGTVWRPEMGENRIQWLYNEGIRVSSLLTHMSQQNLESNKRAILQQMMNRTAPPAVAVATTNASRESTMPMPSNPAIAAPVRSGPATWTIPIVVSIAVGDSAPTAAAMPLPPPPNPSPVTGPRISSAPGPSTTALPSRESEALLAAQRAFSRGDVLKVRMGYVFKDGVITKERAVVVTVAEKKSIAALQSAALDPLPSTFQGFPVEVTGPTPEDLVALQNGPAGHELFGRLDAIAQEITYKPPEGVKLEKVSAKMRVLAHVSPDIGWPTLKGFLEDTQERLVVGMYDFGAKHIVTAIEDMGRKRAFKKMTLTMRPHGSLDDGVKGDDLDNSDAAEQIGDILKSKFECAFVKIGTVNGWVAKSYHIKVAVRDQSSFWLSSGNWQSSNQPDITPMDEQPPKITPLRTFNREWNVIVEHNDLSKTLQAYLLNDFKNNPLSTDEAAIVMPALPDIFVPVTAPALAVEAAAQFRYFKPFDENRPFVVTPLLTPDDFVKPVVKLIESAESEILVQNQTFDAPKQGQDDLAQLIDAIIAKQQQDVSVRVIIRSFIASKDRENLEMLTDRGLKVGTVKFQKNSHTKGVIIDRKKVLVGSQNWSQMGVTINRDASLLFDDEPLARYFGDVFEHDWKNLATSGIGSEMRGARIAQPNESTPAGFVRVNASALLSPS